MRVEFHLPEEDLEYLESMGCQWETVVSNGNWLIIHGYILPDGYTLKEVSLALKIDSGYPTSQIDMVYFTPHIARTDNKPIGALAMMSFDNKQWQRWSRHRTGANPWRPGLDGVGTHISLVQYWLEREFNIR